VIAVTASALGDARATARAAGCVDYLSKPIRAQELFGMLRLHRGMRFVGGADLPAIETPGLDGASRMERGGAASFGNRVGDVTEIHALVDR
jgi:DNA-binding response OmpR family regulator